MRRPFGTEVLDTAVRLLVPFLMVFAVYVLSHGHYSPGGGFQAGALLAVAVVLVPLVRGSEPGWGVSRRTAVALAGAGTLIYAIIGILPLFFGGTVLDYGHLPVAMPGPELRALGTQGIETGVALAVMGIFIIFFDLFETGDA